MATPWRQARGERLLGLVPWICLALVWFASVQVRPLLDPDEGRYAEIPREMLASGDWITPRLDGLKYLEKPPLQYWATSVAYALLGMSEWTARLWTVGLAFPCLPMVYGWAARMGGERAGLVAVVALAVSPLFVTVGHLGLLDAGFTFWLNATVFAFTLAQSSHSGSASERRWMLLAWAAASMGVLTKGVVVAALCGASLVLYTLLERDMRPWRRLHVLPGLALFLGLTVPWFAAVSGRNPGFLEFFFVHEHLQRFLTTVHQHVEPWWYFLPLLVIGGVLPWLQPLARAAHQAWLAPGPTPQFKPLKFLLIFALVTLVFFSASGSKLPPYILPMLPPLAAIVGVHAAEQPSILRGMARAGALMVLIFGASVLIYALRTNSYIPEDTLIWAFVALAASAVPVVITWGKRPPELGRSALVTAAAGALAWQAVLCEYAFTPPLRSARDLVVAARPYIHPGTTLFNVGQYRETLSPYLQRTLILVGFKGELGYGITLEPGKQTVSPADFAGLWRRATDAVAFFDPKVWARYRSEGLPGRVVAADSYTVAVSRS